MSLIDAVILGIVQGLTEFFPVSSSGHLVLGGHLLGNHEPDVFFDVMLHVATLCAVLFYYRRDLIPLAGGFFKGLSHSAKGNAADAWRDIPAFRFVSLLMLASIPTGIMGVLGKDFFESLFASVTAVGGALLFTTILVGSTKFLKHDGTRPYTWWRSLVVGVAQGIAIIPGISRSGSTIVTSLMLGVGREEAARFSFLLSVPAILGALLLKLRDVDLATVQVAPIVVGFIAAAVSGLLALAGLVALLKKGSFWVFAPYTLLLAIYALVVL